jgi:hypothetical protein
MMVKRNMELQLEAMKYGSAAPARTPLHLHGPDHVSSSDAQQWPTVLLRRLTTWLPACRALQTVQEQQATERLAAAAAAAAAAAPPSGVEARCQLLLGLVLW